VRISGKSINNPNTIRFGEISKYPVIASRRSAVGLRLREVTAMPRALLNP
jgi:hypothetical protein